MTKLDSAPAALSPPLLRRLWLGAPIAIGGLLAALLGFLVLWPLWTSLQKDTQRLSQLQTLRDQLAVLRVQLQRLDEQEETATLQATKLTEIVAGKGDLSTLLATIDREAKLAGVQMELYEPLTAPPGPLPGGVNARPGAPASPAPAAAAPATPPGAGAPAAPQPPAPAPGPATGAAAKGPAPLSLPELEGLQQNSMLVSAKGSYPALVDFLHRLERLSVLLVQSDLDLQREEVKQAPAGTPVSQGKTTPSPPPQVVMKLLISLYARKAPQTAPTASRTAPPAAAQPAPQAPAKP